MTRRYDPITALDWRTKPAASVLRLPVRLYGYTLSSLVGRWCRHFPTCSEYMDQALARHGAWAGGWMGFARICRCRPGGTEGIDNVCERIPEGAHPLLPWRYGRWRSTLPDGAGAGAGPGSD